MLMSYLQTYIYLNNTSCYTYEIVPYLLQY